MFKTKEQIKSWLDKYEITNYTINDDLSVDVNGCVNLSYENLTKIPVQFNKVNGSFLCYNNKLTSLEGSPKEVNGSFWCHFNKLKSLVGSPKEVESSFFCYYNKLTSLEHLPDIHGELVCDNYLHDTREYKVYLINKKLREMV